MATKIMREPWLWKRFTSNAITQYLGVPGEPIIDLRTGTPALHVCDGVTPGGVGISMDISFEGIARPTIISPLDGASGVSTRPLITASGFNGVLADGSQDTHVASIWNFYADANKSTLLFTSGRTTTALTTFDFEDLYVFAENTSVYAEVTYEGSTGATVTSPLIAFTTIMMGIGAILSDGGIVFGQQGGDWLVVAPATQRTALEWGLLNIDTGLPNVLGPGYNTATVSPDPMTSKYNTNILTGPTYNSIDDGYGNIGAPAAEHCRSIGYDLPNTNDLQLIYDNRASIDAADASGGGATLSAIQSGTAPGYTSKIVWASTEYGSKNAWVKYFNTGTWANQSKNNTYWVVPIKRIPV